MVKITPLIASMLVALAAAAPQAPSGTEGAPFPTGVKPTGGFPGFGGQGGRPSGTGFPGPKPTGGK